MQYPKSLSPVFGGLSFPLIRNRLRSLNIGNFCAYVLRYIMAAIHATDVSIRAQKQKNTSLFGSFTWMIRVVFVDVYGTISYLYTVPSYLRSRRCKMDPEAYRSIPSSEPIFQEAWNVPMPWTHAVALSRGSQKARYSPTAFLGASSG